VTALSTAHISASDVQALESGLPRMSSWSDSLLVPFEVRQLQQASVLWLNERWFRERGLDVGESIVRCRIDRWLIENFAWAAPRREDPPTAYGSRTRTWYADRYGSSDGRSLHGGSGRAAVVGCFQAKGIGVTPLASGGSDWGHSHGCCSIEELLREAIYAEVCGVEFPHGAVPVIAVLETALQFTEGRPSAPDGVVMRRGIMVRPAVIRPAHAERAPCFRRSQQAFVNRQPEDVQRTRDIVRRWSSSDRDNNGENRDSVLFDLVRRVAQQVAFGQVHRLFNGGYFSSNLTIDGCLLDFGAARALPNWAYAQTIDHALGFGREMTIVDRMIESLAFHFKKYADPAAVVSAEALRAAAAMAYDTTFQRECLELWGLEDQDDPILIEGVVAPLRAYFRTQQRIHNNYRHLLVHAQGWLYDGLDEQCKHLPDSDRPEGVTLRAIDAALTTCFGSDGTGTVRHKRAWIRAGARLRPRQLLYREPLQDRIEKVLVLHGSDVPTCREAITALVRDTVAGSLRRSCDQPDDSNTQECGDAHVMGAMQ